MLKLQARGCHNINWVTPEHVVPQILEALPYAIEGGLRVPIVYNTSGYDSLESLALTLRLHHKGLRPHPLRRHRL
jgi:putative pyruvate formate lyase activating enzyme